MHLEGRDRQLKYHLSVEDGCTKMETLCILGYIFNGHFAVPAHQLQLRQPKTVLTRISFVRFVASLNSFSFFLSFLIQLSLISLKFHLFLFQYDLLISVSRP